MHECPRCGVDCDCDGEAAWRDAVEHCAHRCPIDAGLDREPELGACCACGQAGPTVRNVLMLPYRSPTPGRGWGCFQCGLPLDGATAVVCDACLEAKAQVRFVVAGYPGENRRVPFTEVQKLEHFDHDLSRHPEIARRN